MSINYQWQQSKDNGTSYGNISATGSTLQINHIKPNQHNYLYRCRVNRDGSSKYRYSDPAKLTVLSEISLGKLPSNVSIDDGNLSLSPTVTVNSSATTSFQWQYSDDEAINYYDLPSATGSGLSLTSLSSANNNWLYRLQAKSYYYSGIVNTVKSNNTLVHIENDLPKLQIWRQPQHYYGTGQPEFEVLVASTGLNSNNIPNTFYDNSATDITYAWEYSFDGQNWRPATYQSSGQNKIYASNNIAGVQYRVNVSKSGHSVESASASIIQEFCFPPYSNNFDDESKIYSMNHFDIRSSNGKTTLGLFSNCPQILETAERRANIKMLSLESEGNKYDLVFNMIRSTDSLTVKPYNLAIEDISLFKNNTIIKKASVNPDSIEDVKTPFDLNYSSYNSTITISRPDISAGAAGRPYGDGYCINLANPLHGDNLNNINYKNFISNCIAKSSSIRYGAIKVGVTTTGNSSVDTDLISKLPTELKIKNGNDTIVNLRISYEIIGSASAISKDTLANINVVILNQGYNWSSRSFTQSEQEALKYHVNDGGGLITSEWVLWNSAYGRFDYLKEVFAAEPSRDYQLENQVRYYKYNSNLIINNEVSDDFKFAPTNVAGGTETTFTSFKTGSQLFYIKEPKPISIINLKQAKFNLLDLFYFTAQEAENTTNSTLDGLNKFFTGSFHWEGKVSKNIKIGGALYWIYKSLIEYHRKADEGVDKPNSAWSLGRGLIGDKTDGINHILSENGLNISDFTFSNLETIKESPEEELTANDNFWKDMSKLLSSLKPSNSNYRHNREVVTNKCNIVQQPNFKYKPNPLPSGNILIDCFVTNPSELPISYCLQKNSGNNFVDIQQDSFVNNRIIFSGLQSSDLDTGINHRILFKTSYEYPEGTGTPSDSFQFVSRKTGRPRKDITEGLQDYSQSTITDGNGVFVKFIESSGANIHDGISSSSFGNSGNIISWQYSYDNVNFYNTTSGVNVSGSSSILTLGSGNHNKNIRYSFHPLTNLKHTDSVGQNTPIIKSIAYSSSNSYDPQGAVTFSSNIDNYYTSGGQQYCSMSVYLNNTGINTNINPSDITWEQYNYSTNSYDGLPSLSGNRLFAVSGIKVSLIDTYKFRAIINNRIFYLS